MYSTTTIFSCYCSCVPHTIYLSVYLSIYSVVFAVYSVYYGNLFLWLHMCPEERLSFILNSSGACVCVYGWVCVCVGGCMLFSITT